MGKGFTFFILHLNKPWNVSYKINLTSPLNLCSLDTLSWWGGGVGSREVAPYTAVLRACSQLCVQGSFPVSLMGCCVMLGSKSGLATCKAGTLLNPCPSSQIILSTYILYPGFEKQRHILVVQILGVWGVWLVRALMLARSQACSRPECKEVTIFLYSEIRNGNQLHCSASVLMGLMFGWLRTVWCTEFWQFLNDKVPHPQGGGGHSSPGGAMGISAGFCLALGWPILPTAAQHSAC